MTFQYRLGKNTAVFTKTNGTIGYVARVAADNTPISTFSRMKGIKA